jgi:hypothetical protein
MGPVQRLSITYGNKDNEKTDHIFVRRLKYSTAMRLLGVLMSGSTSETTVDEKGEQVQIVKSGTNVADNRGHYNLEVIAARVTDQQGKPLYSIEDVEAWGDPVGFAGPDNIIADDMVDLYEKACQLGAQKITAYAKALTPAARTPEQIGGNSEPTGDDSSSTS